MSDGKSFSTDHQSHHDLFAVGAFVARIAAFGLGISLGLALEIGTGQIVEVDRRIELKKVAFPFDQVRLDGGAVGMEPIEVAVKGIVDQGGEIHAQNVSQGGGANPIRHRVLAVGMDQPVQGHGAGELDGLGGEAEVPEDHVESQPLPELEADMDGPGRAVVGRGDPVGVDGDEIGGMGLGRFVASPDFRGAASRCS